QEDRVDDRQVVGGHDRAAGPGDVLHPGDLRPPQQVQERPGENPGDLVLHSTPPPARSGLSTRRNPNDNGAVPGPDLAPSLPRPAASPAARTCRGPLSPSRPAGAACPPAVAGPSASAGSDERITTISGSTSGSAAAGTVTPESSANQLSTAISHTADKAARSSGICR